VLAIFSVILDLMSVIIFLGKVEYEVFHYADFVTFVWSFYLLLVRIISEILFMVKSLYQYASQTERVTGIEGTLSYYKDSVPTVKGSTFLSFQKDRLVNAGCVNNRCLS
jgi:hypothetical protein